MQKSILLAGFMLVSMCLSSQSNMLSTNAMAEAVMLGNYDPVDFMPTTVVTDPNVIIQAIQDGISTDSLHSYLLTLSTFENRNTGSDTISPTFGIGAARRWVHQRFAEIGQENEGRLIPTYLQFDRDICGMSQHRNIFAVLPGINAETPGIILIEAHIDSRCEDNCDGDCEAHGMEDNGSGTALVIELARVMSQMAFDRTIVFMATIGEEQGLYGADAFAKYAVQKNIQINAVLNNDVVGGIICGETSSAPSCPGLNHIDSTQVRFFSAGSNNSPHKQLARFIKLEYQEELLPTAAVPMSITIMSAEDRSGRGGDHIPFRQQGFAAMRFCSANEHGNANVNDPDYHDRQHTTADVLGVDTDGDNVIDSFFVDFNYLKRNSTINGMAAALAAIGPFTPEFSVSYFGENITVQIEDPYDYGEYRVMVRHLSNDFDTILTTNDKSLTFQYESFHPLLTYVSVASVDENGIESLFTGEVRPPEINAVGEVQAEVPAKNIELLQNRPNPFDEATWIGFFVHEKQNYQEAFVSISDLNGREISRIPVTLQVGSNEILYRHGYNHVGVYAYSLVVDGMVMDTKRMVFAN